MNTRRVPSSVLGATLCLAAGAQAVPEQIDFEQAQDGVTRVHHGPSLARRLVCRAHPSTTLFYRPFGPKKPPGDGE